jgi:uncharacterized integral membrane protein
MSENSAERHDAPVHDVILDVPPVRSAPDAPPQPSAVLPSAAPPPGPPVSALESRRARFARRAHRVRLYLYAFLGVALLVYVVALAGSNTHRVRVDWVFGSSSVGLVWLVMLAAILGWLLGLLVAAAFRWRTRAPRAAGAFRWRTHPPRAS